MTSVKRNREELVRYLLSQPEIDVNVKDGGGCTPLILAARRDICNLDIFRQLYETKSVNKNTTNRQGEDVLMCAACAGHEDIVQYLLPYYSDLSKKNEVDTQSLVWRQTKETQT